MSSVVSAVSFTAAVLMPINVELQNRAFEDAARDYISQKYRVELTKIDLQKLPVGRTGNQVFLYSEPLTGRSVSVVKQFQDLNDLRKEARALSVLKSLDLKEVCTVENLGAIEGASSGLMEQSVAEGSSVDQVLKQLADLDGEEKVAHLNKLITAFSYAGKGLGELHSHVNTTPIVSDSFINFECDDLADVQMKLNRRPLFTATVDPRFDEYISMLKKNFRNSPGHGSFVHGDPQPSNVFIADGRTTLIDNSTLVAALTDDNWGCGSSARDYFYFYERFREFAQLNQVSEEEIQALSSAFEEGYSTQIASRAASKQATQFFEARINAGIILKHFFMLEKSAENTPQYEKTQKYLLERISAFNRLIEDFYNQTSS